MLLGFAVSSCSLREFCLPTLSISRVGVVPPPPPPYLALAPVELSRGWRGARMYGRTPRPAGRHMVFFSLSLSLFFSFSPFFFLSFFLSLFLSFSLSFFLSFFLSSRFFPLLFPSRTLSRTRRARARAPFPSSASKRQRRQRVIVAGMDGMDGQLTVPTVAPPAVEPHRWSDNRDFI